MISLCELIPFHHIVNQTTPPPKSKSFRNLQCTLTVKILFGCLFCLTLSSSCAHRLNKHHWSHLSDGQALLLQELEQLGCVCCLWGDWPECGIPGYLRPAQWELIQENVMASQISKFVTAVRSWSFGGVPLSVAHGQKQLS